MLKKAWPSMSGQALPGSCQAPSAWIKAPLMLSVAPSRTVRSGPQRYSRRRQAVVLPM